MMTPNEMRQVLQLRGVMVPEDESELREAVIQSNLATPEGQQLCKDAIEAGKRAYILSQPRLRNVDAQLGLDTESSEDRMREVNHAPHFDQPNQIAS